MIGKGISPSNIISKDDSDEVTQLLRSAGAKVGLDRARKPWAETRDQLIERAYSVSERLQRIEARLIFRDDPQYPRQLLDLRDPPYWLFVQGNHQTLQRPSVAIVGTREPSNDGLWLAKYVGFHLKDWSVPTVSGLALGIDQEVHLSSIRAGVPTVAFLGTGIFSDYPKNSGPLREQILKHGGAVSTEYLPAESYGAKNFVRRNRLQAALACTLIPIEWNLKSGTAHTVRYAASLGREIAFIKVPYGRPADWESADVVRSRSVYCLPKDQSAFTSFVQASVNSASDSQSKQLSLF